VIELIKDVLNKKQAAVNSLKTSTLPIVIYGAGSYAEDTYEFLKKHGIRTNAFCVDKKYLSQQKLFKNKFPIIDIEKIHEKYTECEMVIGFADHERAKKTLKQLGYYYQTYFIDAPDQDIFFDYSYIKNNQSKFAETLDMLADQRSKDIFIAFINAKISSNPSCLYKYTEFNQYFPGILKFNDLEVFVDCGAYNGDTILNFVHKVKNKYQKIYAFEPDLATYQRLMDTINKEQIKDIEPLNLGTWSKKTVLQFSASGTLRSSVVKDGKLSIPVEMIDTIVQDAPVSFLKMDIEGSELESLRGAQRTIKTYRPKLAICVYHKPEDLITIPQYINELVNTYKLYLRQHQFVSWDMVLYATPG
jgi:FkbM family methyltransferase